MVIETQTMTNSDFLHEVLGPLDDGHYGWVCNFRADPNNPPPGIWGGRMYMNKPMQAHLIDRALEDNTYLCPSVLKVSEHGEFARRKECFHRLGALVLDDVQPWDLQNYSWLMETSPGSFQSGHLLAHDDPDTYNADLVDKIMRTLAMRGSLNDAAGNGLVRYVRLPYGVNTKPRPAGTWQVRMAHWDPRVRWSLEDACAEHGIDLDMLKKLPVTTSPSTRASDKSTHAGEMLLGITNPDPKQRDYHDNIVRLAASLVAGGMFPGAAVQFLYSVMDESRPGDPAELARWESRRAEIPRAVTSAEKFAPQERQQTVTINLSRGSPDEPLKFSSDVERMDWAGLQSVTPEPTKWRWDGWLPQGTVTLLSAHGGVGKSNLSLQLGVALAHGRPLFDVQASQCKVMVISAEDEARTVHFRVANICEQTGLAMSELHDKLDVYDLTQHDCVIWRDGQPTARMQWLADLVVASKADVVILDNASDVFADNENDRTAVRGFMRCLNLVAHKTGCAVLVLAHVDKASVRAGAGLDSNTTFSGSTAWNNSARSRWAMVRENNSVILRHEKCNLGPLQEPIDLEFDPIAKVFVPAGSNPALNAAATVMRNSHRASILRMINQAVKDGRNLSTSVNANNNAYATLKKEPDFPRVDRATFFSILRDMQRESLIDEVEYVRDRKKYTRLGLTKSGEARVAVGSGAPPVWAQREDSNE